MDLSADNGRKLLFSEPSTSVWKESADFYFGSLFSGKEGVV